MRRREFLRRVTAGCAASSGLGLYPKLATAASLNDASVLAPKPTHFPAKAKNLVFIFLSGGFSQLDTFDPKPALTRDHGKKVEARELRGTSIMPLLASIYDFKRYGRSGLWVSELFPHLGTVADELCVIRSLHSDITEHSQGTLAMHTGSATVPMPSIGSWISYALGTHNADLPSYMVLASLTPYSGSQNWDSNFLPPFHQGVRVTPGEEPIPNLKTSARSLTLHQLEQRMLRDANELHAQARAGDLNLRARMNSFRTASGMMRAAPNVLDTARESASTRALYGIKDDDRSSFAWQCLVARRLVERGVRVVELIHTGSRRNWDSHGDMAGHRPKALAVDQAITGLVRDLKERGLLGETLIAICTEFGRTPWYNNIGGKGRSHYGDGFTCLLLGAGVRGGMTYGATDEHGIDIVENPVHVRDYHATILHLMGLDHNRVVYRYAGRDFRLTDVGGKVLHPCLV